MLLDYQATYSLACDGLPSYNWHHYTDCVPSANVYTHTDSVAQLTVTVLNHFVVSVHCTLEACVCV